MRNADRTVSPTTLRELRRVRGWTQQQAGHWAGVSERTWRRWEASPRPVTSGSIVNLLRSITQTPDPETTV